MDDSVFFQKIAIIEVFPDKAKVGEE